MDTSTPESQPARSPTAWVHLTGNPTETTAAEAGKSTPSENVESPPLAKRRRTSNRERSRVSRACDRCKKKKAKCTGRLPCPLCLGAGLKCEYTALYTRGRLPSVVVDEAVMASVTQPNTPRPNQPHVSSESALEASRTSIFRITDVLGPSSPHMERPHNNELGRVERLTVPNEDASRDPLSRSSPEATQTDQQGHYIGPSSGASFLLRIQRKLHENNSWSHDSSIFTFGDARLPEFDTTFFVLPPKYDAQRLVERYFDFAAPTHRFLHRPTIERMLDEFYDTQGDMRNKEDAHTKTALLLIVFAQAQAYMPPAASSDDNSARYYFAAERQLAKERGAVRLASVQARLVQCYYLLAQSRINQCWSLFGTTAHLALAIGLNRGRRCESRGTTDYVELECRRRVFWSAYVLDKFLAAALGRPMTFRDEDIDQELPTVIDDHDLHPLSMNTSLSKSQSVMMAPVEHIKLSRIVSCVLRDLYPIRPPTTTQRLELATKYSKDLREWRAGQSRFLDAQGVDSSLILPLYQRQRNVLNLSYYHTMLLVHRPFLLSNFASLSNTDARPGNISNISTSANIAECLSAAMGIVTIVDDIFQGSQIFRAFWFTQYYAFCAVVVLYIYRIQQHLSEPGKCDDYFAAGQKCQAQLSSLGDTDCLSKRYCLVLEELRLEAARQTERQIAPLPLPSGFRAVNHDRHDTMLTGREDAPAGAFATPFYGGTVPQTPESEAWLEGAWMADLTSWGQFDSLVTAGIGVLDGGGGLQGDGGLVAGFGR